MDFKRFSLQLGLRVGVLTASLVALVSLLLQDGYPILRLLFIAIALLALWDVLRFVKRTNSELTRFLDALRYADFSQRFEAGQQGAGFEELGAVLGSIIQGFADERATTELQLRHLAALTEHVPVPLVSLHPDARVVVHNNAARRLFGTVRVNRLNDLQQFGADFYADVMAVKPGERRLTPFLVDGMEQRLSVAATEILIAGRMEKLLSLQNIQSELDSAQLQAWQDLVRVLTHEIMNSITPITSLATTASALVGDACSRVQHQPEVLAELQDARDAVDTVARRSDGLLHFVQSYRQLTRLPEPRRSDFSIQQLLDSVVQLQGADPQAQALRLRIEVTPPQLELHADREMLEQVLLNLLQNAKQALAGQEDAEVLLSANLNRRGSACLEVSDNGPGVAADIAAKVFVPFFTTRREGSGVGLALTRQVMLAHGGSVSLGTSESGGARFTLTF